METEISFLDLIDPEKLDRWKKNAEKLGVIKIFVFYSYEDKIYFPYWIWKGDNEEMSKNTPDEENEYVGEIEL